jgi:hypothetical protein
MAPSKAPSFLKCSGMPICHVVEYCVPVLYSTHQQNVHNDLWVGRIQYLAAAMELYLT